MKHAGLSSGLSELREILKAAIDQCNTIPDASAEIRAAVRDHSLSCLSIEKVIELVKSSEDPNGQVAHDRQLLQQHLHAAQSASSNIRDATSKYRNACLGLGTKARRAATRYHDFTSCLLSNLARIITALNSTILLFSIRLNNEHTRVLIAKLRSLIASCQQAHGSSPGSILTSANRARGPRDNSCRKRDTEVQALLQPSSVAYIVSELRAVHAHAGRSAFGITLSSSNSQLLDVNLLGLLLEQQPAHPLHTSPPLVSHYSDVILAARTGDHERLAQILEKSPELLYCFTIDNLTLMCFAIESGEIETVNYLLRKGIGVNDTYGRNDTCPLATALQFRHLNIVRLFIQAGAKFEHRNKFGWSPLFYIWFKRDRSSTAGALLGLLAASTAFDGMHRDVYDKNGWTVMHRAAIYGTSQDVSTLIQLGVNPFYVTRAKDKNPADDNIRNYSVLQRVVLDGLVDTVRILLPLYRKKFGNIDLPDEEGWTLLHMAISEQHLAVAQMLVENDANIWAITEPTLITRVSETDARRYNPFLLAESFGPHFYECFVGIVRKHQQLLESARSKARKKELRDSRVSVPSLSDRMWATMGKRRLDLPACQVLKSRPKCGKVFGGTKVSDHATAHMGDSIRNYHITNYSIRGKNSKAKLKRLQLRKKLSEYAKTIRPMALV